MDRSYFLSPWLLLYGIVGAVTWTCAAAFHASDTWLTERLDYNSAFALVAVQTSVVILRTFLLRSKLAATITLTFAAGSTLLMALYMNLVHFDYGLNVKLSIAVGVLGIVVQALQTGMQWVAAWRGQVPFKSIAYSWKGVASMVLVAALTAAFEVNDFPPLLGGLWDAHSLWHLTSAPVGLLWYSFLCDDWAYLQHHKGAAVADSG